MTLPVRCRLAFALGAIGSCLWWGAGCRSDDLSPYDYAVEIRRDAKVLLTTRPSNFELITADASDR